MAQGRAGPPQRAARSTRRSSSTPPAAPTTTGGRGRSTTSRAYWADHGDVASTMTTGWYDGFPHSETEYYAAMAAQNTQPQRLIVGPWSHVGMRGDVTYTLDVDFGGASRWGVQHYFEQQLAWFNRFLPDDATGQPAGRGAGEDLRDGRRQRPAHRGRQARPRRRLARRVGVAARARRADDVASARRRVAARRGARGRRNGAPLHLRPRGSGADDRRQLLRRRRVPEAGRGDGADVAAAPQPGAAAAEHHDAGPRRPEGVGRLLHGARAVPAAVRASGRARVPDRAARSTTSRSRAAARSSSGSPRPRSTPTSRPSSSTSTRRARTTRRATTC